MTEQHKPDDAEVMRAVKRRAERELRSLQDEVRDQINRMAAEGQMNSSRSIIVLASFCERKFDSVCDVACKTLAEILGADARRLADELSVLLNDMSDQAVTVFTNSRFPTTFERQVEEAARSLTDSWIERAQNAVDDLRVGIAGGQNVAKEQSINIDNQGGAAQIVVNSPNSTQTVQGDQSAATGVDINALKEVLAEIRKISSSADVPAEIRDQFDDAIVATERELEQSSPDEKRLLRYLVGVRDLATNKGLETIQKLIESRLAELGLLSMLAG